ncbi:MAG: diaminopimelate epimerase [Gemmataceae bacterium]
MRFTKMHGIGNDYVYFDCVNQAPPADPARLAQVVSDRHFGIGSDGLILICRSERGDARMRMFNADGSESEMCGNGVRCVAKFVHDHGLSANNPLKIETGRGVLTLHLEIKNGKVEQVRVDMGEPILDSASIPTLLPGPRVVQVPLPDEVAAAIQGGWQTEAGFSPAMTCVSMGNPHLMLYCTDVSKVPLETVGPRLEHAKIFPRRINVHFVQVQGPGEVIMRTWERGSGITLACGTGACAVAVASYLTGQTGRQVLAHLPGGDLHLEWAEADHHVYMTGPATEVFSGEWSH